MPRRHGTAVPQRQSSPSNDRGEVRGATRAATALAPARFAVALAAGAAWVLYASDRRATRGMLTLAATAVVVLVVATIAMRLRPAGALALTGAAITSVALWLLPQRDDLGSLLVLSVFFAVGIGLACGPPSPTAARASQRAVVGLVAAAIALGALRAAHDEVAGLVAAALAVWCAAVVTRVSERSARRSRGRVRERIAGTLVVVVVATTAMYFGASSTSATWFGGGITHGSRSSRMVALTFDDGPNAATTLPLMQLLDAHHVKATFFIVGKALVAYPSIVRTLVADGELVGNHSYHHDQWRWLDPRYPELERTQAAFARNGLPCPAWYRPPHGQRTPFIEHVVKDHHMRMVLWDVSVGDWATNDAALIARRVLAGVRPGSIIVLHDGLDGNPHADRSVILRAMPTILAGLKAKHLQPVRLDQLLGGPAYTRC
jgi:peptidoglycan/xylan/chitin deacetylase (PgdA/CDA1 family)